MTNLKERMMERLFQLEREIDVMKMVVASIKPGSTIKENSEVRKLPITSLTNDNRVLSCLANTKLKTIGDVANCSESELLRIPNLGRLSLQLIKDSLWVYGLELRDRKE